ncbi:MAG TPA: hypothetical protein VGP59_06135, partial [Pyrinomonadaceae bacterium]|nr:hypothetical protein [Pyrinomonadaceae bacterium]
TLGVSRLLHSYSTLETMEIYNAVIGEPERVKDDYYYRSRKAVLMHEMYQRFGELIRVCRQRRGEERFETQQGSTEQRSLVRECLRLFTPWDTQCPVPRDFDPFKTVITSLISKSSADENRVEVNRIHAVLHPNCFERLVAAFGYGAPDERMELPRFFSHNEDDQSPPRQRSAPEDLNAEELAEINNMLGEQARRRRRSSPDAVIRIVVDGVDRARLNPAEESSISFSVEDDAELIEFKTTDASGELLLATHLITSSREDVSSIRLEGGQDLSLSITRRGETDLLIKFGYRETATRRAVRLWWHRFNLRSSWVSAPRIVAVSVVIICVASYLGYVRLRTRQTVGPEQIVQTTQPPVTKVPGAVSVPVKAPSPQRIKRNKSNKVPADVPVPDAADETRSGNVVANLTLKEVKKVYIEIRGDADELRSNVIERLNSSGIVAVTTADEADAALKIVVSQNEASARLVNARGTVLWPVTGVHRYTGDAAKLASEIVKDLLSEIRSARAEH